MPALLIAAACASVAGCGADDTSEEPSGESGGAGSAGEGGNGGSTASAGKAPGGAGGKTAGGMAGTSGGKGGASAGMGGAAGFAGGAAGSTAGTGGSAGGAGLGGNAGSSGLAGAAGNAAGMGGAGASGSAGQGGAGTSGGGAGQGGASGGEAGQGGAGASGGEAGAGGEAGGASGQGGAAGIGGAGQGGAGQGGAGQGGAGQGGAGGCGALTMCGGGCFDLLSDPAHCGSCDMPCSPGEECSSGACLAPDLCSPDPCHGHGTCLEGACTCEAKYTGPACDKCAGGVSNYPECACQGDADCVAGSVKPYCDQASGACVACVSDSSTPPAGLCKGVCSLVPPSCVAHEWACTGPGYEAVETSCDGFDNNCDGKIDEGCPPCTVAIDTINQNLGSVWDIDFDFGCNAYLTSLISGPDFTRVVSFDAAKPVETYYGNANQDMGFGLVDPDPNKRRVVVSYSCGDASCLASNGMTLLYTCSAADPGCGCAGQANCPGFLNQPFLASAPPTNTALTFNGYVVSVPTGLAVAAGSRYFVGNFQPLTCDSSPACTPCDPSHPGVTCTEGKSCCDSSPFGRLAEFTLPKPGSEPTFRVDHILEGEQIFGLASARNGSIWIGTYVSPTKGNLYRYDPVYNLLTLISSFSGTPFSITQSRTSGDWYLEVRASPKLVHLNEFGQPLPLPATIPSDPPQQGILQAGPDNKLYRLIGKVDAPSSLEVYDLP